MNDNEKLIAEARAIAPGVALSALDLIPDGEQQHGCIISDGAATKDGVVSAFRLLYRLADALEAAEKAHNPIDTDRAILDEARRVWFGIERGTRTASDLDRVLDPRRSATTEPQGEPSDAQVEAAGALLYGISWGTDLADPDLIRDALRAARDA